MKIFYSILFCFVALFAKATDSTKYVVYFDFNISELNLEYQKNLTDYYTSFDYNNYKLIHIVVVGHTDQIGSDDYNYKLSFDRSIYVANFLVSLNIAKEYILPLVGYGESMLLYDALDEISRAQNRRVEIITYFEKLDPPRSSTLPKNVIENKKLDPEKKHFPEHISDVLKDTLTKVGDQIILPYILFHGGLPIFMNISYPFLDELVEALRQYPKLEIEVQGHVCCTDEVDGVDISTGKRNLSSERAKAVYDYLIKNGISKKRMTHIGYGHQYPITQERNEYERSRNRRVEIKILKK